MHCRRTAAVLIDSACRPSSVELDHPPWSHRCAAIGNAVIILATVTLAATSTPVFQPTTTVLASVSPITVIAITPAVDPDRPPIAAIIALFFPGIAPNVPVQFDYFLLN